MLYPHNDEPSLSSLPFSSCNRCWSDGMPSWTWIFFSLVRSAYIHSVLEWWPRRSASRKSVFVPKNSLSEAIIALDEKPIDRKNGKATQANTFTESPTTFLDEALHFCFNGSDAFTFAITKNSSIRLQTIAKWRAVWKWRIDFDNLTKFP